MSSPAGRTLAPGFRPAGSTTLPVVVEPHVLLHEHGVGALGHRRAGENPHRMARLDRLARRRAGLNAPGHGKRRFRPRRQIAAAHGIAVDGGIGEGRQRQRRRNVARRECARRPPSARRSRPPSPRVTRAAMMPTASSTDIIGPPKAKQSSDNCAMLALSFRRRRAPARLRPASPNLQHHSGDGRDVIEMGHRQRGFNRGIGGNARYRGIAGEQQRLAVGRRDAPRSCDAART